MHSGVPHSCCCPDCVHVQAHVRYVDALYASGKFEEAAAVLHETVARDPTFRAIPEYKVGALLWAVAGN